MTDDRRAAPQRQDPFPEQQFASITMLQGMMILHALVAGFIGFEAWKISLGFGVMGAESARDFYPIHVFYLMVFGMTPALNLLACGSIFAIFAATSGFVMPLFIAVPAALMVALATKEASRLDTGFKRGRSGGWRLAALDLAVLVGVCAVLAIPVALFDNQYHVF